MKKVLLITALCYAFSVNAQIEFSKILTEPMFQGVNQGAIAYADIDGDNDLDVLISGYNAGNITKLYKNNGFGEFSEVIGTPFTLVLRSSIAFADIDGDGDKDVLISGSDSSQNPTSKIYTNDGTGNFTDTLNTTIHNVQYSSIAFADIDGDNDLDLFISGYDNTIYISKLYTNNGSGSFTEVIGTSIAGISSGSIGFADIDADNDQDLFISGFTSTGEFSKMYLNNGSGSFTEVNGTTFTAIARSSIAFLDVEGDTDLDLIISGHNGTIPVTELYINDGLGNYTIAAGTTFTGAYSGSISIADIDGDNDQDILITGLDNVANGKSAILRSPQTSKIYTNNGSGNFTEDTSANIEGVYLSSSVFFDANGNGHKDLIIIGATSSSTNVANYYKNNGNGVFTDATDNSNIINVQNSKNVFADIDGDNDEDLLIAGFDGTSRITKLYNNNGSGQFTENTLSTFEGFSDPSITFADIDNDNDLDLLISGTTSGNTISKLYSNDSFGKFTEVMGTTFPGIYNGEIVFEDIDGDSDLDILIIGSGDNNLEAKLYKNDGTGNFTEVAGTPFIGLDYTSISFADIDGDTDKDVIITGRDVNSNPISKLYKNDGLGVFTEVNNSTIENIFGKSVFADVDGDNDKDLLISGINASNMYLTKVYINNGSGTFNENTNTTFIGLGYNDVAFSDFDNDNDLDVLLVGNDGTSSTAKLYANNGLGVFSEVTNTPFLGVNNASIAIADFDGNNSKDIIISGNSFGNPVTTRYRNLTSVTLNTEGFISDEIKTLLYPNPNKGYFQIQSNEAINKVEIYTILGQRIKSFTSQNQYDISNLSKGMYLVKIFTKNNEITKRIMKE